MLSGFSLKLDQGTPYFDRTARGAVGCTGGARPTPESPGFIKSDTRVPIPMKAGRPARFDYEYERNGTANLFMMFAPLEGWRHVKVTDRHTAVDYARVLKD